MTTRQLALVAAFIPAIAFASTVPATNKTWNASNAAALLLENEANIPGGIRTAAGTAAGTKLAGLTIKSGSLTCVVSGPAASGKFVLTLTSSTDALADSQFPRWIAKAFAVLMGCSDTQVDVWLTAARRLTVDGRRLTATVNGVYNVYNPLRGRNIALGIGLGVVAPAIGLGVGLGEGMNRDVQTTPVPTVSATPAPVSTTTAAPEEGSSMPLWAGILLALACLACIGAAVYLTMDKGKKKKTPKKKAAPVKPVEEVRVVEEVVPLVVQQPTQYIQQPVQQPTFYTSAAAPPAYVAPAQTYQPTYQPVGGSVRMF